ncbi:MAG: glycosyltransferase family 2 protein [Chloroflexi bacterium]|nr:glycosyltransferase family 2 protein [Chloroflexota bacterium]
MHEDDKITLSIIIVSYNTASILRNCLQSVLAQALSSRYEIIVVDNASGDGSPALVAQEFPAVTLIANTTNVGFGRANNQGIQASHGRYVLLLNSDTLLPPGALVPLLHFMDRTPRAGACSPRLLRPDGTPQPYAFGGDPTIRYLLARGFNQVARHRYLHDWSTNAVQEVDWVSGACLMVRRAAIDQVGLLDENIFMYFEDNDWCLRLRRAGWKIYYNPTVQITHLGGQSLARNPQARRAYYQSLEYFYAKHYNFLSRLALKGLLPIYRAVTRV